MTSKDKRASGELTSKFPGNGSCLRPGIQESDTGDSGEESEPTYRHYDNFETDVCLTQDEDEEPLTSNKPIVPPLGSNLTPSLPHRTTDEATNNQNGHMNGFGQGVDSNRGLSSDSDSCTETELMPGQSGHGTDDTTTSTSESEETQIWVPISKRPSARQMSQETTTPINSGSSSNDSDHSRPQSYIHKTHTQDPGVGISVGSLTIVGTPTLNQADRGVADSARRGSRESWHGAHRRVSPSKQINLGLLRHDETTGTITLDIRNMPNGDSGLGQDDVRYTPSDDAQDQHQQPGTTASIRRQPVPRDKQEDIVKNISMVDRVCAVCSGLYMLAVVTMGVVIPVAEVYVTTPCPALFEGFYIYLHVVSIAFLAYVYAYIVRKRIFPFKQRRRTIITSVPVQNRKRTASGDVAEMQQTGSFYLRLGAVGFGIGSMINIGLHFGEYFEMTSSPSCRHALYGIRPVLHLMFTFVQLYFVFLNSKMLTHKYTILARFGLMHMIATNMCVWLENIVMETVRQLDGQDSIDTIANSSRPYSVQNTGSPPVAPIRYQLSPQCYGESMMGEVVVTASPYLFPCTVIYSIICAGVLLVIWLRLGNKRPKNTPQPDDVTNRPRLHVDCSSSSRGLFLGIIVFVAAIIILITFFVLVRTVDFLQTAIRLDHLGDVAIYVVTTVAVILAFHRTHVLQYSQSDWMGLEEVLLVLSLMGVYVWCISNIISGVLVDLSGSGHLIIISNCLRIVQSTAQTVFLLNTMRRHSAKKEHGVKKPGREFVTFLLISNVALWGMNMFEVQMGDANPLQQVFYGNVTWYIIAHVTVPLTIFFRFHSTVCLANLWKHAWDCPQN